MKRIYNNILIVLFLLMTPQAILSAQEAVSLFNKQELEDMIAAGAEPEPTSVYTEWNERNPFDMSAIETKASSVSTGGTAKELTEKDFIVQGVFLGSAKPSAIINNTVVAVGDKIKTAVVVSIAQDTITLKDDKGRDIILNRMK